MAKVYVSSTFLDLQECREQVMRVLRAMGHEDMAMEYYVAEDQRPVDKCLADVAACDLYAGIFAWRYGWVPKENNPDQLSITELEYRQAVKTGKPCLIFFLEGRAPWPPDFIDDDKTQIKKLRAELNESMSLHISNPLKISTRSLRPPFTIGRKNAVIFHTVQLFPKST